MGPRQRPHLPPWAVPILRPPALPGDIYFGGSGGERKAQRRTIQHWSEQVSNRFGGHTVNWDNAKGKEINCNRQGSELHCVASAHPCS